MYSIKSPTVIQMPKTRSKRHTYIMHWCNITVVLIFSVIIIMLQQNIDGVHLKERVVEKKDYTPSKWVAKSAMDVWYGNLSMIQVISNELAELMYKLTARPGKC